MEKFLKEIEKLDLFLIEKNGDLILNGRKGKLDNKDVSIIRSNQYIIEFIKKNKQELIEYILKNRNGNGGSKNKKRNIYELSPLQEGMLFHGLYDKESSAYVEQLTLDFVEGVDLEAFKLSWNYLLKNHTILRSSFYYDKLSIPVQCVFEKVVLPIDVIDFSAFSEEEKTEKINTFLAEDIKKGFDFAQAPLMRITLIKLDEVAYKMVWAHHHILLDGWSLPILMEELQTAYQAYIKGEKPAEKSKDEYQDYIKFIKSRDHFAAEGFWKKYLNGFENPSLIPFADNRQSRNSGLGKIQETKLNFTPYFTQRIKSFAQTNRITVNTLMQGVWAILLAKYANKEEVVYGVTVSGRPPELKDTEKRVGLYINTLPLRVKIGSEQLIVNWLQNLQEEHTLAREYQYTALNDIQKWNNIKEDFFDNILVFENYPISEMSDRLNGLKVANISVTEQTNYLLSIAVILGEKMQVCFDYKEDLLSSHYVEMISQHFENVLNQIVYNNKAKLSEIYLLTLPEKQKINTVFNKELEYPKRKTILDFFKKHVERKPNEIVAFFEDQELTFQELNDRANQLAHYLNEKGIKDGAIVAICLERSLEMLIGILGVIKAGAAFLPIDPEYPKTRIDYIIEDAQVDVLLTLENQKNVVPAERLKEILCLDTDWSKVAKQSSDEPAEKVTTENVVYIIYTSGSTGKPKGVIINHQNLAYRLLSEISFLDLDDSLKICLSTNYAFDVSMLEVFLPLVTGGSVLIPTNENIYQPEILVQKFIQHGTNSINGAPSFLLNLLEVIDEQKSKALQLIRICAGGESLNKNLLAKVQEKLPQVVLHNVYGPTEITIDGTIFEDIRSFEKNLIGRPFAGTYAYIVDAQNDLVPIGVAGELWLGGDGVAQGYLNRPELSAEKFITNPFRGGEKGKIYKTGDLARWSPDGNIEFLGRKDDQVKVRGQRVELGEIETVLQQVKSVSQCVVLAKKGPDGNNRLVAYVVAENLFNKDEIKEHLKAKLPDYMVPSFWIAMETFPLTPNGKVDKKALPEPDIAALISSEYLAPRNNTEAQLVDIWKQLLNVPKLGVKDNFFELGGHSLLVTRLVSAIRKHFSVGLSIKEIFTYPTIAALSSRILSHEDTTQQVAIQPQERPQYIPLSFAQERLWFIDSLEGSTHYHLPMVSTFTGALNVQLLEEAFREVIERHEVLRTIFIEEESGMVHQVIQPNAEWQLTHKTDLQEGTEEAINNWIKTTIEQPFDLAKDYMLRANVCSLSDEKHLLVLVLHHIASDGWSMPIFIRELVACFEAKQNNATLDLAPLPIQYADYAIWQRTHLDEEALEGKLQFWEKALAHKESLNLPTDFPRAAIQSTKGKDLHFKIDPKTTEQLRKLSQETEATLFMLLLSAFKVLLHKYSGQDDISVGSPIANRMEEEVEPLIGFFVNTLVLRSNVEDETIFTDFLQKVKATTLNALDYQDVPFEKIVERVEKNRDRSRSPLFQAMFLLQNDRDVETFKIGELTLSSEPFNKETSKFELTFEMKETAAGLDLRVEYDSSLFLSDTITRMAAHFERILATIATNPSTQIGHIGMLDAAEKELLLEQFNDTAVDFPTDKTIVDLFEEQVAKTPDNIAISFEDTSLTYRELEERSNQLAHHLKGLGLEKENIVPLCIERSIEMMIGLMGILKAGGAYLPVDPEYPQSRIEYMLQDSDARIILTQASNKSALKGLDTNLTILSLDEDWSTIAEASTEAIHTNLSPENLMYVIYTSGSTGKPKGVMNQYSGVVNRLLWAQSEYQLVPKKDVVLQKTTFSFDVSVWELFWPLITGVKLAIARPGGHKDSEYLKSIIDAEGVTTMHFVPSMLEVFLLDISKGDCQSLRQVLCSGEALKPSHVAAFKEKLGQTELHNLYGPTEAAIDVTSWAIPAGKVDQVLIGKPVANTQLYVLDAQSNPTALGVPGELHLAGIQVARGYLNRPALTAERFIDNPFSTVNGDKLYKTGDLVRWLPDGNIEYLGRIDHQVKIRGYRIELGEIENVLQQAPAISQCVVTAKDDPQGNKRLVAYLVGEENYDKSITQEFLKERLPEYMVPALFVEMEALPITSNGKINRKALPEPDVTALNSQAYVAPRNETEEKLVEIWKEVLKVETVGVYDDFFELGGHSLLATRLRSAIRKAFSIELSIKDLFAATTVATCAELLQKENQSQALSTIVPAPRLEYIPLSFSQERLWFIDQLEDSVHYNIPEVLRAKGDLDRGLLEDAFQEIVNRHETLRTIFKTKDDAAYQYILPENNWNIKYTAAPGLTGKELQNRIDAEVTESFDLSKDHLIRVHLFQVDRQEYIITVVLHHIIADGWSIPLLVQELVEIYEAKKADRDYNLPALPIQYADFAIWQRNHLQGDLLENQLTYWEDQLKGVETLELATDFSRPPIQSTRGNILNFTIESDLTTRLSGLAKKEGVTSFMLLLSAFKVLLHRYSGQTDICVGSPIANRTQSEIEPLIGFFLNTLALRSDLSNDPSFQDLLGKIKATTLDAYANQEVPFERIVDRVKTKRDRSRTPIFQVLFSLQNNPETPEILLDDVLLSAEPFANETTQYDIIFNVTEKAGKLEIGFIYCSDLYRPETVERMVGHYQELLNAITQNPAQKISELGMLSSVEIMQQLFDFNDTEVAYPQEATLVDLFDRQVQKNPNQIALVFEGKEYSYQEIDQQSDKLAAFLQKEHQVKADDLIGIMLERSHWAVIAILGIVKSGAAYVPIDLEYPAERKTFIINDTQIKALIIHSDSLLDVIEFEVSIFSVDIQLAELEMPTDFVSPVRAQDLVYVIYTSGSTGRPKGVMIEHNNLSNYLHYAMDKYRADNEPFNFALFTSLAFDLTQTSIFLSLITGGVLMIENGKEIERTLEKVMKNEKINVLKLTPSHINLLEQIDATSIARFIVGGEKLEQNQIEKLFALNADVKIFNEYGPTEATIGCTVLEISRPDDFISIGKPISNTQIYITGANQELIAIGQKGEIAIGGAGVARGYLNRPELTTEKFVKDVFGQKIDAVLYKTGDLARWLPDGNIEYFGRVDHQVKIRGYRIELGEIETVLLNAPEVDQCAVVVKENNQGNKNLLAYIVGKENYKQNQTREYLLQHLPSYMIPNVLIDLPELPLTQNGKIDKKYLSELDPKNLKEEEYIAPRNAVETAFAELWKELLGVEKVSAHDNFFELGGDSIITIQLVSRAKRIGYHLRPSDIFEYQTLDLLAKFAAENQSTKIVAEQGTLIGSSELLPIQQWFLENEYDKLSHFNQAALLNISKDVPAEHLAESIKALVSHHDALRFVYQKVEDLWVQTYGAIEGAVDVIDIKSYNPTLITQICEQYQQSLNIEAGELIKAVFIKTPDSETHHRLFLVVHHLAIDGVSWRILLNNLEESLLALSKGEAIDLGPKTTSYRAWSNTLKKYATSTKTEGHKAYWESVTRDIQPLPVDKVWLSPLYQEVEFHATKLEQDLTTNLLQDVHHAYRTEINDLLLAALAQTLHQWSGNDKITLGLEGHGREDFFAQADISATVGWFTSLYPVSLLVKNSFSEEHLIKSVKEQMRAIPDKGLSYGPLRYLHCFERMKKEMSIGNWEVVFNYLGQLDNLVNNSKWFSEAPESIGKSVSDEYPISYKLEIVSSISEGQLNMVWNYSTQQYHKTTIEKLGALYMENLRRLIIHCRGKTDVAYTPSDLGLQEEVTYEKLDEFRTFLVEKETDGDDILTF